MFYSPAQHKTNKNNNSWIQEYAGRLPEKQTLIELATYLVHMHYAADGAINVAIMR